MQNEKILILSKRRDDYYAQQAIEFTRRLFPQTEVYLGLPREPFPQEALEWQGDYIISYLCPWVVPAEMLARASKAAINFHPAPPQYPGTGCTNFAIYDEVSEFGATCHHMASKVDSGKIIAVSRFPVFEEDTVYSLTQRCYSYMLALFFDIIVKIARGEPLPESNENWTRQPYRLKDLNELKRITTDMPRAEVLRRIKAVAYPGYPGAYVEIAGERFTHTDKDAPI
jgi:methionyl-tRNA formyltransferase